MWSVFSSRGGGRAQRSRTGAIAVVCAVVGLSVGRAAGTAPQGDPPTRLSVGIPLERRLGGAASHRYVITLGSGQFGEIRVDQLEADALLILFGPDNRELALVNDIDGGIGTERAYLWAEQAGEYSVEVRAAISDAAEGAYAIQIHELRQAVAADRLRVEAQRLYQEAETLRTEGRRDSARRSVPVFEAALARWRESGDRWKEAQTLSVIGRAWTQSAEYRKSIEANEQAIVIRREIGERRLEAVNLNNLGTAHYALADFQAALDSYQRSLPLRRETGDRGGEAWSLGNIAVTYSAMGENQRAVEIYPEAIALWRSVGDKRGEAMGLHNSGAAYGYLGEFHTALDYLNRALTLRRATGDRAGEAQTLSMIGNQYSALSDPQASLEVQNQALPLRRAAGDRRGEAYTLRNIGQAYVDLGDPQTALTHLDGALAIFRAVGDKDGEPTALIAIADAVATLGDVPRSIALYADAIALYHSAGSRRLEAEARSERGDQLHQAGRTAEALSELTTAAAVLGELRATQAEAGTLVRLARTERDLGHLDAARRGIEMALDRVEALRATALRRDMRASYLSTKQNAFELHVDILMALHREHPSVGYAALALQANERARARGLLETLAEAHADVRQSLEPALNERQQRLQRELNGRAANLSRVLAGPHTGEQATQADTALKSALNDSAIFDAELRSTQPQYAALTQARPLATEAIQHLLDPDTVLLEYALGRDRSHVWAVTPSSLSVYELPPRVQIEAAARKGYEAWTNSQRVGRSADVRLAVDALSQMLLRPVAQDIAGKRLVIVADGALQFVPFGALTEPSDRGGDRIPLVVAHEVVSIPSASVLDALRQPQTRTPADRMVAVLADPVLLAADARVPLTAATRGRPMGVVPADVLRSAADVGVGSFGRLRFTREEALAIGRIAGPGSLTALGFEASRSTAIDPALGRYRIVHFATHAFADSEHPELSGIVLSMVRPGGEAQDGFLRLHDIYNLKLGADLVVLSACQTALGKDVRGEGLVGLTRGFMYAGAPRVVASLWNVSDESTSELMTRFYRAMLNDGLTPAAALRRAQVSMWKDPAWSAPFYWAGFTLQGDWRPAVPAR